MRRKATKPQPPLLDCSSCKRRMAVMESKPILFPNLVDVIYACERCGKSAKRLVRALGEP